MQLSTLHPGDLVTVQGERVSRFFVVISGSIGTLNHAAAENWHLKTQGPLAQMKMLSPAIREAVCSSEHLVPALLDIDAHPMNFCKYLQRKEVLRVLAAAIWSQSCLSNEPAAALTHGPSIAWSERPQDVALHDSMRWSKGVLTLDAYCALGAWPFALSNAL
jgi:CRP-like cAMP-binding protein